MSDAELKDLDKEVKKLKRIAGAWSAQMHDLVEERLPGAYAEIPALAQATYDVCKAWHDANLRLTTLLKG
ncbi:MAG: CCE_0567 family metalloprotein [Rhodocyclaceae bacterium]|nr:CCE_0567 family metalloprotein [Rhodocyclaceae bacterium]